MQKTNKQKNNRHIVSDCCPWVYQLQMIDFNYWDSISRLKWSLHYVDDTLSFCLDESPTSSRLSTSNQREIPGRGWVRMSVVRSIQRLWKHRYLMKCQPTSVVKVIYPLVFWEKNVIHLKFIVLVFGPLVEGPVVTEASDIIDSVEALDAVRHTVHLQHINVFWNWIHCVDLEVYGALHEGQTTTIQHKQVL